MTQHDSQVCASVVSISIAAKGSNKSLIWLIWYIITLFFVVLFLGVAGNQFYNLFDQEERLMLKKTNNCFCSVDGGLQGAG